MPDHSAMRLGKLEPRHDPRTLRLERYLDPLALPPIPAIRAWDTGQTQWGMMQNDRIGDCTCAAVGHQIQTWTVNNGGEVTIPDGAIVAAYTTVSGYDPQTGANDNGAYELDVLKLWRSTGVGGHKLYAWADVDPKRHDLVTAAVDLFGGVYIGLALPLSAQSQAAWEVVSGPSAQPGSWGGHAVVCIDYDPSGLTCITWGGLKHLSWAFWDAYCDEAHAILGPEWSDGSKQAPSGFDLAALQRDLAIVSGQPEPGPPPWQPDPEVTAALAWELADTTYLVSQYQSGNLAGVKVAQANLAAYAPQLAAYFNAQTGAVPELPR